MSGDSNFWVGPFDGDETYQLVKLLGGGGEGEVWQAILPLSEAGRRPVAVKIMPASGEQDEAASWARFGHLLQSLAHPGLVRVTDVFLGPGQHRRGESPGPGTFRYVVMDYVEGPTLRDWVDENPAATAAGRLALLRTAASALDEMHSGARTEVPVAHGDVKPANIVVDENGGTVLVDLGLARLTDAAGVAGRSNPYAAPEIREANAQASIEADAYAFAVTVAQVLTGQVPPTDDSGFLDVAALQEQLQTAPVTQRRPMLVHRILGVLTAATEARPKQLRQWLDSAAETLSQITTPAEAAAVGLPLSEDITHISAGTPAGTTAVDPSAGQPERTNRRRGILIAAVVAVLVLLIGGGAYALTGHGGKSNDAGAAPINSSSTEPSPTDSETPTDTVSPTDSASPTDSESPTDTTSATDTAIASDTASPADTLPPDTQLPATTQWVGDMDIVDRNSEGSAEYGSYNSNGKNYPHSLETSSGCYNSDGGDAWFEYDLSRSWSTIDGVVGLVDSAPSDAAVTWKVYGDGKVLVTGSSRLGTSTPLHISVKNVLRLRVLMNTPNTSGYCENKTYLVWGDLQLTA